MTQGTQSQEPDSVNASQNQTQMGLILASSKEKIVANENVNGSVSSVSLNFCWVSIRDLTGQICRCIEYEY